MASKKQQVSKKYTADSLCDAALAKMILEVGNTFTATRTSTDYRYGGTTSTPKSGIQMARDVKDRMGIIRAIRQEMKNPESASIESVTDILENS